MLTYLEFDEQVPNLFTCARKKKTFDEPPKYQEYLQTMLDFCNFFSCFYDAINFYQW